MVALLPPRTALRESLPVVPVLLLWTFLAWLFELPGLSVAGIVIAVGYVLIRGMRLADGAGVRPLPSDVTALLAASGYAFLGALPWVLLAKVVEAVGGLWNAARLPGLFVSPVDGLAAAFTFAAVATVGIAVVASATVTLRPRSNA